MIYYVCLFVKTLDSYRIAQSFKYLDNMEERCYGRGMKTVEAPPGKRPLEATRERGVELRTAGLSFREIALLWNVSPQRVYQVINGNRSRKRQANGKPPG